MKNRAGYMAPPFHRSTVEIRKKERASLFMRAPPFCLFFARMAAAFRAFQ